MLYPVTVIATDHEPPVTITLLSLSVRGSYPASGWTASAGVNDSGILEECYECTLSDSKIFILRKQQLGVYVFTSAYSMDKLVILSHQLSWMPSCWIVVVLRAMLRGSIRPIALEFIYSEAQRLLLPLQGERQ